MIVTGGSQLLNATLSMNLSTWSVSSPIPVISFSSFTPKISCPPSVLANAMVDAAKSSAWMRRSLNSVWRSSPFTRRAASSVGFMVRFLWQVILFGGCVLKGFDDERGCRMPGPPDTCPMASSAQVASPISIANTRSASIASSTVT